LTVLDTWAVLRWLEGVEPAAQRVESAVSKGAVMNWVNVGEVFYVVWRSSGETTAHETIADLRAQVTLDEASPERVLVAARIKAEFPMALGDAFAAATATAHRAPLLTGDPELLNRAGPWEAVDLR
jgi:predicted nucleic acid-binding protein